MPTAHVHVGTHKTGTSAFQLFMRDHADWLRDQGLYVPKTGQNQLGAHHPLGRALCNLPQPGERLGETLKAFRVELAGAGATDILISSEDLSLFLTKASSRRKFFGVLKELGYVPRVYLYFRDPVSKRNSNYTQYTKTFRTPDTFAEHLFLTRRAPDFICWRELNAEPTAELVVRPYNRALKSRGIIADLLETMGVSAKPPRTEPLANTSPGPVSVGLSLWFTRHLASRGICLTERERTHMRRGVAHIMAQRPAETVPYIGLTDRLAARIRQESRAEAEEIACLFFDATWSDLYAYEERKSYTCNDIFVTDDFRPPDREWAAMKEALLEAWRRVYSSRTTDGSKTLKTPLALLSSEGRAG